MVDQVLVAERDAEHPLAEQRRRVVRDAPGCAAVGEAGGEALDQPDRLVRRAKQQRARVRWIARQIARLIRVLEQHLAAVEAEIEALVAASPGLSAQARRLRSVPGIGPAVAAVLLARLPELGRLDRRGAASLAGLAPHACDSGLSRGKRRIWGGHADLRRALYIAAFVVSRYASTLKAFRQRLKAAGKPVKLAITACARKLLTILNAMFRNQTDYRRA